MMDKILYKDNKFELAYNENGMYFISGCNRYELLCHPYEPIIYIKASDGSVDIVIHNSFILSSLKTYFENGLNVNAGDIYGIISAFDFCEILNSFILKDKFLKKKRVRHAGYSSSRSSNFFNEDLVNYYKGYLIYGDTDRDSWDKTIYRAVKYGEDGEIYDEIEGDFFYCKTLDEIKNKIDEHIKYLGTTLYFHDIECVVSYAYGTSHYKLIAINEDIERLQNDKSFSKYHQKWTAVALPIKCPCCNKITWFDNSDIPKGEKYEVLCNNCNSLIFRKK